MSELTIMAMKRKKRALVLAGAGASLEFGAPSTAKLTRSIGRKVENDSWLQKCGGHHAYQEIFKILAGYLKGGICAVNFEHVYHCAHELLFTFDPSSGTVDEYRPILQPFICRRIKTDERALRELVDRMAEFIFKELSVICDKPTTNLGPLTSFIEGLRKEHITRIYTTNYDDFLLQAAPDLYTGFDPKPCTDAKRFDRRAFWRKIDADCVFHLHGSVHLSFPFPPDPDTDLGELHWFDDRTTALHQSSYHGTGERRMDGSQIVRAAVITGLDKFSRLQQQPLSHYYASMTRDAMIADIIYVIGYGLSDLHLNMWLGEARRMNPVPPLVFIDRWPTDFLVNTAFGLDRKTIEMLHTLRMYVSYNYYGGDTYGNGWTLAKDRNCAIWDKGFLAFLNAPEELRNVLSKLI